MGHETLPERRRRPVLLHEARSFPAAVTERSGEFDPLKPTLVVEVQYDHFTGGRFRHGNKLLRWRPEKAPKQCKMSQVEHESRSPLRLIA
jgi:ATP-dependent DNA ligase